MNEKRNYIHTQLGYWSIYCSTLLYFFATPFFLQSQHLERYEYSEAKMGTRFHLVLYAPDSTIATQAAQAAFTRIDQLNKIFSDYDPSSEVSRLSTLAGSKQKVLVSKDLWTVLSMSQNMAKKSKGAFDITIGPLSKLWRRAIRQKLLPESISIENAKDKVCYKDLKLYPKDHSVRLKKEGMRLDLGGIAKGYTVDAVIEVLSNFNIMHALIDGGGDIYVKGSPPDSQGWKIKMLVRKTRTPSLDFFEADTKKWSNRKEYEQTVYLSNTAIASSGNTFKYLVIDKVKYSHIIDPSTGLGLTHNEMVNVQAPSCALADALASTLSVLSIKKGRRLLKKFPECVLY